MIKINSFFFRIIFILTLLATAAGYTATKVLAQSQIMIIDRIQILNQGADSDVVKITGSGFQFGDNVRVEPLNQQIDSNNNYQWLIIIPNADLSPFLKQQITTNNGVFRNDNVNVLREAKIEVTATQIDGVLKSTVLIRGLVDSRYFGTAQKPTLPVENVAESNVKEFLFRKGLIDADQQYLTDRKNSPSSKINDPTQLDLGVPILRINIIGADGARSVASSKAAQVSIYLNEQRREELSQKFGIQFFVNNVSIDRSLNLPKTIIYYRYDENNSRRQFLKEALYIAKIIPSESILKPLPDPETKPNVDIEILVGKNLR